MSAHVECLMRVLLNHRIQTLRVLSEVFGTSDWRPHNARR